MRKLLSFKRTRRLPTLLALLALAGLATAALAFGDIIVADGDGVSPIAANDLAFGSVNCGQDSTQKNALVGIRRNGSYGAAAVFQNGANVTVDVESTTGPVTATFAGTGASSDSVTLPSTWQDAGTNNFAADTVTSNVKIHPTSAGASAATITYRARGTASNDTPTTDSVRTVTGTMTVTWTAGSCNTAPTVTVADVTGGASYNKGSVPVAMCSVTDAEDGPSSFPATLSAVTGPYASDGIGDQTASCSYTDGGGLTATDSVTYGIVDPSPPSIEHTLNPAAADGDDGWYKSDVTLAWTVTEPQSPNSLVTAGCVDQNITADQSATNYSCAATSAGGSAGPVTVTIKRDATPPTNVQFNSDVAADGARYFPTTVPTGTGCTADDATSGIASCVVTGRSTAVGTHALTATATDKAGNTATATRSYRVRVLTVSGFFQPVDMGGAVNTVKGGSTVPLKFTVSDEGVEQNTTSVVNLFMQRTVNCGTLTGAVDEIEIVTTGGTILRYDATAHQFIQNWQTPKKPGTCMQATVTLIDGTVITANFQLK
jgi:hypothetical protein